MSKPKFVYVTYITATPEKVLDRTHRRRGHEGILGTAQQRLRLEGRLRVAAPGLRRSDEGRPRRETSSSRGPAPVGSWSTWAPSRRTPVDPAKVSARDVRPSRPYKTMVRLTVTHEDLEPDSAMLRGISFRLAESCSRA